MPVLTRRELQDRIQQLEAENEGLQSRLDEISDIVTSNDEAEERKRAGRMNPRPVCGTSWRKPAYQITDRAKRYRAHTPECVHPHRAVVRCAVQLVFS